MPYIVYLHFTDPESDELTPIENEDFSDGILGLTFPVSPVEDNDLILSPMCHVFQVFNRSFIECSESPGTFNMIGLDVVYTGSEPREQVLTDLRTWFSSLPPLRE